ncbi:MAG: T9SS type A sorting domain-containing protein [Bacteroidetes bacterium]|nr:T9SS type A sorting domain-containing protein [Bacteroidota bacterium]
MRFFNTIIMFCVTFCVGIEAQIRQITTTQQYSIDVPSLDVYGTNARIAYGTNFSFYSFHILGPEIPISTPSRPDQNAWAPVHVSLSHVGNIATILYTDFERNSEGLYTLKCVTSTNDGLTWSAPTILDVVSGGYGLNTTHTNQLLKANTNYTALYAFWRKQIGEGLGIYFAKSTSPSLFASKKLLLDCSTSQIGDFDAEAVTFKSGDYLVVAFSKDSLLCVTRSIDGGETFSEPLVIDSLLGQWSYFSCIRVAGSIGNYFYIAANYWQMVSPHGGGELNDMFGTRLYCSKDKGATWIHTITFPNNNQIDVAVNTWNYLVFAEISSDGNLYVRTSANGRDFSPPVMVNAFPGSASGKYDIGFDMKLDGSDYLAIAWVDTTTGYDEVFYRYLQIPQPPMSVEENAFQPIERVIVRAYPNPFNPNTRIQFSIPSSGSIVLKLFDILGREVATLVNGHYEAGTHELVLNGTAIQSGVYFVRINFGQISNAVKILLVK